MNTENSRSKKLLDKVYDHLDTIDVTALSMNELKDFLEVVQKGQFLETYGQANAFALTNYAAFNSAGVRQSDVGVSASADGERNGE